MNNAEIIRDMQRKYSGTYVLVDDPAFKKPGGIVMKCRSIEREGDTGTIHFMSPQTGALVYQLPVKVRIRYKFPNVGTYQNGAFAEYFYRTPARQWRRGICADNAGIVVPGIAGNWRRGNLSYESLTAAFDEVKYDFHTALDMLVRDKKHISIAVHGDYIVSRTADPSVFQLMYRSRSLCLFTADRKIITNSAKLFERDYLMLGLQS